LKYKATTDNFKIIFTKLGRKAIEMRSHLRNVPDVIFERRKAETKNINIFLEFLVKLIKSLNFKNRLIYKRVLSYWRTLKTHESKIYPQEMSSQAVVFRARTKHTSLGTIGPILAA
jgi:hypothetical protein